MKNHINTNEIITFINQHNKEEVLPFIKAEVLKYQRFLTSDMVEALNSIDDFLNLKIGVYEARQIAFDMHRSARSSRDLKTTYLYRTIGHAVATIHVKTHALRCYEYLMKFHQISEDISHD